MRIASTTTPLRAAAAAAFLVLAGCNEGGGTGVVNLRPGDVADLYQVCELSFVPSNTVLPRADLLRAVVDTTPPSGRPEATLALSQNGTYDLVYTRQGDNFLQQVRGSASYGSTHVNLNLGTDGNAIASELLLPRPVSLRFTASGPKRLTAEGEGFAHAVARADYARAAGISDEGLQNTINGQLRARLVVGSCP